MPPPRQLAYLAALGTAIALTATLLSTRAPDPQPTQAAIPRSEKDSASKSDRRAARSDSTPTPSLPPPPLWRQLVGEERWEELDSHLRARFALDPWSAATLTAACGPSDPFRDSRAIDLFADWSAKDPEAAAAWLATLEDSRLQNILYPRYAQTADPAEAAAVIAGFPDSRGTSRAAAVVADRMAATDPAQAARWSAQLPHAASRESAAKAVAARWIPEDPHAAADWIQSLPNEGSRSSTQSLFAREMLKLDPEAALLWALEIQSPARRDREILDIGKQSLPVNPSLTRHLFQALSIDPELARSIEP
jgi:hypothetical protein